MRPARAADTRVDPVQRDASPDAVRRRGLVDMAGAAAGAGVAPDCRRPARLAPKMGRYLLPGISICVEAPARDGSL